MGRPRDCPRCGQTCKQHTGTYCQVCGELLVKTTQDRIPSLSDAPEPSALLSTRQELLEARREIARLKAALDELTRKTTPRAEGRPAAVITAERIRLALHRARPAVSPLERRYVDDLFSHMEAWAPYAELGKRWGVTASSAHSRIERALLWAEGKRRKK